LRKKETDNCFTKNLNKLPLEVKLDLLTKNEDFNFCEDDEQPQNEFDMTIQIMDPAEEGQLAEV